MQPIRDLMHPVVEYVDVSWTVLQVVALMRDKHIGSVLIKEKNQVVGIFTERDLLTRVDLTRPASIQSTSIREVMTTSLQSIEADSPFIRGVKFMREHRVRHLPVMEQGAIIGIISSRDLLAHYYEYLEKSVLERLFDELMISVHDMDDSAQETLRQIGLLLEDLHANSSHASHLKFIQTAGHKIIDHLQTIQGMVHGIRTLLN